jgi:hypothetical protein
MVLKFNHVDFVNLKSKKYLFIKNSDHYSGKFVELTKTYAHFIDVIPINKSLYRNVTEMYIKPIDFFVFYELKSQKQKIQEAMENRALQQILQKIIGDNHFVW